ncbi:hypothetical protein GTP55_24225 [Duganella sp. FT109W]|uniref:Uncharacterized protein n=1 Tax=Duganella margarita TaxID=2692170 RepID=A0ABW9WQE9_9BURK|nr:hypothetical protein [Duganella margarita]MYN42453.1 hypothetical protein [Duganella margarita]
MEQIRNKIIRVGGAEEVITGRATIAGIESAINAETLDTVNLRDGRVMLVDDLGISKKLPVNEVATKLYHSVCRKGTTAQIHGDVAVVYDEDFA